MVQAKRTNYHKVFNIRYTELPPKQRVQSCVQNDAAIAAAKLRYGVNIGHLFAYYFPRMDSWVQFNSMTFDFLAHISHLIGV